MMPQMAFMIVKSELERQKREDNPGGIEAELREMQFEAAERDQQPTQYSNVFTRLFGLQPITVRPIASDECAGQTY